MDFNLVATKLVEEILNRGGNLEIDKFRIHSYTNESDNYIYAILEKESDDVEVFIPRFEAENSVAIAGKFVELVGVKQSIFQGMKWMATN